MLLTECFPLSVQGVCAGVVEGTAQIGAVLAPIIISFCINQQLYPMLVLSFIIIFTDFIPTFWIEKPKIEEEL